MRKRLVMVSNRLPISVASSQDGGVLVSQGAGGLATALASVLTQRGGIWIGWPGTATKEALEICRSFSHEAGYALCPVGLSATMVEGFYRLFSNQILWPLFHEFPLTCELLPAYWDTYWNANALFAQTVAALALDDDFIWVHDYHLMLVGKMLKACGATSPVGFFLHIPFPPADVFSVLPWGRQLLDALLEYDLIGFQTQGDLNNFYAAVKQAYPVAEKKGQGESIRLVLSDRSTRIGCFPIGVDFHALAAAARQPNRREAARTLRAGCKDRFILFGADRLDATKGVPQRLQAFQLALARAPELRERICLVQVMVPNREWLPQYQSLKTEIEQLVDGINQQFSLPGWVPVQLLCESLPLEKLIAYYLAADMVLVTSLRDGMNLVAKEYAACNTSETGILCLSEFAGAARELSSDAVMVNPYDICAMAEAILKGTCMDLSQRCQRMRSIRAIVRHHDIFWWVDAFLNAAISPPLKGNTQGQ